MIKYLKMKEGFFKQKEVIQLIEYYELEGNTWVVGETQQIGIYLTFDDKWRVDKLEDYITLDDVAYDRLNNKFYLLLKQDDVEQLRRELDRLSKWKRRRSQEYSSSKNDKIHKKNEEIKKEKQQFIKNYLTDKINPFYKNVNNYNQEDLNRAIIGLSGITTNSMKRQLKEDVFIGNEDTMLEKLLVSLVGTNNRWETIKENIFD